MLRAAKTGGRAEGGQDDDGEEGGRGVGEREETVCRGDQIPQQNQPTA